MTDRKLRKLQLHVNQDVAAGVAFSAIGAAGLWLGRDYPIGTSLQMGPGYMPAALSSLLALIGLLVAIRGALAEGQPLPSWHFRPLILVSAGLLIFSLLIESAGLPVAVLSTVIVGALGGREFRFKEVFLLGVGLAAGAVAIFAWGLGLPFPVWPRW